jgi:hypothetical protein
MRSSLALLLAATSVAPLAAQDPSSQRDELVYYDFIAADGSLAGGRARVLVPERADLTERIPAPWRTIQAGIAGTGSANRIDMVFVGDGYTSAQLAAYTAHVALQTSKYFLEEPFKTYRNYYQTHQIDVVSIDSGVDNDPVQGVLKNTALDMKFWCNGIERLLCVNVSKAYAFANNAPDVDLVVALANSTMYGGAGYPTNDLATASGGNALATEILLHELGHALGNLADEYDYADGSTYIGPEPVERNASKLTSTTMAAQLKKWHLWLGTNNPAFDGLVSTYEGAVYKQFGVYRPTNNSLMRNLGRPFNLPSIESIVVEIYKIVDPIDTSSSTAMTYTGSETLFVDPLDPIGHSLTIEWRLDGTPIPGATQPTLDLAALALEPWPHVVSATVADPTGFVKDPALRATYLTQTRNFQVQPVAALSGDKGALSTATGGVQSMSLSAGAAHAQQIYLVLGSLDPAPPGTSVGAFTLPLDVDAYLLFTLGNPNQPPLGASLGVLDAAGGGHAQFTLPAGLASFAGQSAYHAFLTLDPAALTVTFTSNALRVELLP